MSVLDLGDAVESAAGPRAAADSREHDDRGRAPQAVLPAELAFYESYAWSLNPHLTVGQAIDRLRHEIDRLAAVPHGWQTDEVVTNVFLLCCGLLNCVDDHLRGPGLRLPWRLAAMRPGRAAQWVADNIVDRLRLRPQTRLRGWRDDWVAGLDDFLSVMVAGQASHAPSFAAAGGRLAGLLRALLRSPLRSDLQATRLGVPSPFRRLDLTHHDVLGLGRCYVRRFPDRAQPILLVGLRTSGSYFAPLLRAFLKDQGYTVAWLTIVPGKGPGRWERKALERHAAQGYRAVIVDDPPHTGGTIFTACDIARRAGFDRHKLKALIPVHPATQDWHAPLPDDVVVSLEPAQWHKRALLDPQVAEGRLDEYFRSQGFARVRVVASGRVEEMNARLQGPSSDERSARLKRIFEVHLETPRGGREVRHVLAKSVGWGWLGYHAFLAGHRLAGFVPPILGQRDGILYMEWIPARETGDRGSREAWIDTSASYAAARVRHLNLDAGSASGVDLQRQDAGVRLLGNALSRAYGAFGTGILMQPRLARLLRRQPCPLPTLIDGKMQRAEWVMGSQGLLKTDYEHHGMGKEELNVVDPAYDLADTILHLELSPAEERRLIRRYIDESGDTGVERRLFRNKLLAGLWAMKQARAHIFGKPRTAEKQQAFHLRFMNAWHFLTVEAARYCGRGQRPAAPAWRSPLVALDIDGVLDRRLFGFPCTTAAGIEALSLLRAHGVSVVVDTARSVAEVKAYCAAYGLAGGIAEHGGYMWDAVSGRGQALISPKAARQLDELRCTLRRIPGVFLDDRHQYSIRAFTYRDKPRGLMSMLVASLRASGVGDGALAPLPALLINHVMAGFDRLSFHHTSIDTTVVAKEVDKGSGLVALRDWVLGAEAETIAVGDQEPDLAMFRVATRSFAPANIGCARQARLLGCGIARHAHQRGLLEIARALAHPDGGRCERCANEEKTSAHSPDLFMDVLRAADRSWIANLMSALVGRSPFR